MIIDHELIVQVQHMATEDSCHRAKTLIACYVGFVGLADEHPELRERARAIESALRAFCTTGRLPKAPIGAARTNQLAAT
jgi:hypothetical protein